MILDIEIISDSAAFKALEGAWTDLLSRIERPHYFQRFEWVWRAWEVNAQPKGRRLCIAVGRHSGRVVLIWPLAVYSRRLAKFLACDRGEYRDVLMEPGVNAQAWLGQAFGFLAAHGGFDILLLQDLRPNSELLRFFGAPNRKVKRLSRTAPYIPLDKWPTFDDYMAGLSRKLRGDQRRQWLRLAADYNDGVKYEVASSSDDIVATLDWLYAKKLEWMRAKGLSSSSFSCDEYHHFLHNVCLDAHADDTLLMSKLVLKNDIVAASIGFLWGGEFTFYMFGYDNRWGNYSPGRLLMERNIQWAMTQGARIFDFMAGNLEYKGRWADHTVEITEVMVPCTRRGAALVAWFGSDWHHRLLNFTWGDASWRLVDKMPPSLRRVLHRVARWVLSV